MPPSRTVRSWLAPLLFAATAGAVHAAPVSFGVSSLGFSTGSGYGQDNFEINGTLLDVNFVAAAAPAAFSLDNVGDSFSFDFGTITFNEQGQIRSEETDGLGVSALFTFVDPLAGVQTVVATGTAFAGPIVDALIDFTIEWAPLTVAFGNGGQFEITMDTVNFRQSGAQRTPQATITLRAAPAPSVVPEPASLALAATALFAGAVAARRRRRV